MKQLATLTAQDVEPDAPVFDYPSFIPRSAVRAVVFDGDKVALLKIGKHGYYMLPGGGIDNNEDVPAALKREVLEELGCTVGITGEVGSITIYNDRWKKKQTDFCYTAQVIDRPVKPAPTDFETEEGHEVIWARSVSEAIALVEGAKPANQDGKLIKARDLLFLQTAAKTPLIY